MSICGTATRGGRCGGLLQVSGCRDFVLPECRASPNAVLARFPCGTNVPRRRGAGGGRGSRRGATSGGESSEPGASLVDRGRDRPTRSPRQRSEPVGRTLASRSWHLFRPNAPACERHDALRAVIRSCVDAGVPGTAADAHHDPRATPDRAAADPVPPIGCVRHGPPRTPGPPVPRQRPVRRRGGRCRAPSGGRRPRRSSGRSTRRGRSRSRPWTWCCRSAAGVR